MQIEPINFTVNLTWQIKRKKEQIISQIHAMKTAVCLSTYEFLRGGD